MKTLEEIKHEVVRVGSDFSGVGAFDQAGNSICVGVLAEILRKLLR